MSSSGLRDTYCSTIAYEVEHISNHEQRSWLRQQIESGAHRLPLSRERKLELLDRLTRVESFERYLRKAFLGQKTFSIEGLDVMVPMLEEMLVMLAEEGTPEVRLGMAHRGRLAVITHVVDRPYEEVLEEFEHAQERGLVHREGDVTGDVKYHQGASGTYETPTGKKIRVVLANNPSHLEAVDSVVEGQTRAVQTDRTSHRRQSSTARKAAAILIHGDAAFDGQGVVAEVFNLQALEGYTTGGTVHVIANNQIGFTTLPPQGRSTRYASDSPKALTSPSSTSTLTIWRRPSPRCIWPSSTGAASIATQSSISSGIAASDTTRRTNPRTPNRSCTSALHRTQARGRSSRQRLIEEGTLSAAEIDASLQRAEARVASRTRGGKGRGARSRERDTKPRQTDHANGALLRRALPARNATPIQCTVARGRSRDFTIHPKLARQLERRLEALGPAGEIDWGLGEAFAFGEPSRRRHSDSPDRPRHRAGNVQPPPLGAPRCEDRRGLDSHAAPRCSKGIV